MVPASPVTNTGEVLLMHHTLTLPMTKVGQALLVHHTPTSPMTNAGEALSGRPSVSP